MKSRPEEGSTFVFHILADRGPDDTSLSNDEDNTRSAVNNGQLAQRSRNLPTVVNCRSETAVPRSLSAPVSRSILIVEDNLVNQAMLKRILLKRNFQVETANHGQEALDLIMRSKWNIAHTAADNPLTMHFDIILCDIEMPVMDGRVTIRRIRELQETGKLHAHIPAIAVSANARDGQIKEITDYGFDAMVTKPYKFSDLTETLERFLIS